MSDPDTILRGVTLSRVDRKSLTKAVKTLKLACDTSVDSMVASLADHLVRLHKDDPSKLLGCDFCGGSSDLSFPVCPYCGKTDAEATKARADAEAAAPPPPKEQPVVNAKAGKKPRSSAAAAPKPGLVKTTPVVHQAELVSSSPNAMGTVADLDSKVAAINQIQVDIVDNHWRLGQMLGETWTLFKLRTDDKGAPKYKNWGQFVSAELGFTPNYAYDLIGVSRAFTEADIKLVGVTKLRVIARIPEEAKRQNLLERAKNELVDGKPLGRRAIEEEARGAGGRRSLEQTNPNLGSEEAAKKRAAKAAERAVNKGVSVVVQPGRITVPLYNAKLSKGKEPVRAFDLSDEPQAIEDMLNGIKVRYAVSKEPDGLVLTIERTRE